HLSTRSVRQIIIQNGVYRPDVPGEALGSLLDASVDRAHDPDERAIGAVVGERAPDHRDPGWDLTRDGLPLGLVPVEDEPLLPVFLDEVAVHRDGRMRRRKGDRERRGLEGLAARS